LTYAAVADALHEHGLRVGLPRVLGGYIFEGWANQFDG
jgi:hypothetical protein